MKLKERASKMACNYLHMFLNPTGDSAACDCMHLAWEFLYLYLYTYVYPTYTPIVIVIAGLIHTAAPNIGHSAYI